jgi:hypothetical protein
MGEAFPQRKRRLEAKELSVLLSRSVSVLLGPVITVAVGLFFSPVLQGYYYLFASIAAAANFFEAGISTAIIQFAAHEASNLKLDLNGSISGTEQAKRRLASTFRFALKWYSFAALIAVSCIGGIGGFFLAGRTDNIEWLLPFSVLVISLGLNLALQPFFVLLEGVGKVSYAYRCRTVSAIATMLTRFGMVVGGVGLMAMPIPAIIGVIVGLFLLLPARKIFLSILKVDDQGALDWRSEIWPFQSKIAISWMAGYFTVAMFTPVLMTVAGPAEAGQVGMTVALFSGCTALAASFIQAHAPALGGHASAGSWSQLNALFLAKAKLSVGVAAALVACITLGFGFLKALHLQIADRVVGISALIFFALGFLAYHCEGVLAFYIRAQKREPYFVLEIIGALVIFPCTVFLGRAMGSLGVAVGFAAAHLFLLLPIAAWILSRNYKAAR